MRARTIAYVRASQEAADLAWAARLDSEAVDVVVDEGQESFDALQDAVYGGGVERVLLPTLALLGGDLMTQETVLAGWAERGILVFCRDEPDLGAADSSRQEIRGVLGSLDEFGKIPWVP